MPRLSLRLTGTPSRAIFATFIVGALLHAWAIVQLPVDFDEPTYVQAGFDYAAALKAGDWNGVINYAGNREHPALVKLLYALPVLVLGKDANWANVLYASRAISAVFGTLAALLLALVDPFAGGMFAVDTLVVKYTSQAYLEALPLFASIGAVLALKRSSTPRDRWFWLSAFALGATFAGKFTYFPIVGVIVYLFWEKASALSTGEERGRARVNSLSARSSAAIGVLSKVPWLAIFLYGLLAGATFLVLNPTLWNDTFARLADTLFFYARYSQSASVQQSGYPWFQPLLWISWPVPWHPEVFFYYGFDMFFFLLALFGLPREWRARRWIVVWIAASILILLLWPTKWPQYTLVLIPALCLAAAETARRLYRRVVEYETYWHWLREMLPPPTRAFWILSSAFVVLISLGFVVNSVQIAIGRVGWSHFTSATTLLPSDTVYAIQNGNGEEMVLATERGVAIWSPAATTDVPDTWITFTTENSPLPNDRVLAITRDRDNRFWFGTAAGLSRFDGHTWQTYRAADLHLGSAEIHALQIGTNGRLWVGTRAGVSVFDGAVWTSFTASTSGLLDDSVLSLAVEPRAQGDIIWIGSVLGVSRLDTSSGALSNFTSSNSDLGWGGVAVLLRDTRGRIWAATLGGGISAWDGERWQPFRTSESELPLNTINKIVEIEPGTLWVALARSTDVGGAVARFNGTTWKAYTARNSGYSGAEPLAFARDRKGRLWIGTRTRGVDLFQLPDK
ncbi:MAG: hypothetical protein KGJ80_03625 [Chloroflexota bacterium]|nr:hypothetical protein [Chloroflexota bacterium]